MAEALYRKYRPQIFEDVVGQEHIERTIKNAISQDKVSHAYLFTGPRGTGKTTTARLLAKALLCQNGPTAEPDGTCEDCQMIAAGEHPDVYELDAASRTGVENVREEIISRVQFAPTRGRYKVYIIDEVHMLSVAAFNALLKTLEEPPDHVVFILATTDPQKVPETIHSRCQRFDFKRISNEAIVSRLGAICVSEGVEFEGDALDLVAHRAEGGMRNALTSLEQLIAFGGGSVTTEIAERLLGSLDSSDLAEIIQAIGKRDAATCFNWTADFVETGADLAQFTRDLAEHIRNLYVMSIAGTDVALDVSATVRRELESEIPLFGTDRLARLMAIVGDLSSELRTSANQRLTFEIALTRMVRPESDVTLEALAERIETLEGQVRTLQAQPMQAIQAQPQVRQAVPVQQQSEMHHTNAQASYREQPAQRQVASAVERSAQGQAQDQTQVRARRMQERSTYGVGSDQQSQQAQQAQRVQQTQQAQQVRQTQSAQQAVVAQREQQPSRNVAQTPAQDQPVEAVTSATEAVDNAVSNQVIDGLRNPAALQRMWQTAIAQLKKKKAAYGVLFLNTKASLDETAKRLVIEFPAENDFAFKAVQKPDVQDELTSALGAACGVALPFSLIKGNARVSPQQSSRAASTGQTAQSSRQQYDAQSTQQRQQYDAQSAQQYQRQDQQRYQSSSAQTGRAAQSTATVTPEPSYYEEVPVDLYDDMGYVEESAYEPMQPQQQVTQARTAQQQPAQQQAQQAAQQQAAQQRAVQQQAVRQGSAQQQAAQQRVASAQPTANQGAKQTKAAPSIDELDSMLAFGFGEGVTFTEIDS